MAVEQQTPPAADPTPSLMDAPPAGDPPAGDPPKDDQQQQQDDQQQDDQQQDDQQQDDQQQDDQQQDDQPIEYTDFTVPEGVELDTETLDELKALGVDKKLSQEDAQKLVDLGVKLQQKNAQAFADAVVEARAGWREAAIADPEFGGKNLSANLPIAVQARDKFGTPELKTLLDESGLGDHPEVIRFFYRVGKATGDHDFVKPGNSVDAPVSFYDHPTSKPTR